MDSLRGTKWIRIALCVMAASLISTSVSAQAGTIAVNIESTPPGAQVFLDSTTTLLGVSPMRNERIARGAHTLIFRMEGHEEARLPVNVVRRGETFRMALVALGRLSIRSANDAANGAAVRVDGQDVGVVPVDVPVPGGRHLVQVGREGYVTSNQWVEVAAGQSANLVIPLERDAPQTGSILIAADVPGARVFVDGTERGVTPTLVENLPPGVHAIELRADGLPPKAETVTIVAGQRATINATIRPAVAAVQTGSLRILTQPSGAMVSIDGEAAGESPVARDSITAGEHVIDVSMTGYEPAQQLVTIEPARQRAISIMLTARAQAPGRIVVNSNVGDAVVTVDGMARGAPPVVIADASEGPHAIVVTAPGYDAFRTTCSVGPGQNCELNAELTPQAVRVRVTSNINNAEFVVDGTSVGPVPFEGTVPAGSHRIEVRAEGYVSYVEQVDLLPQNEARPIFANLQMVRTGPSDVELAQTEEQRVLDRVGALTHAAGALPTNLFVFDMSLGWPYLAEIRLGIGILEWFEAGFAIRSLGRLTEFEARGEFSWRPIQQFAFGALARLGGGVGPDDVNSFFASVDALASLYFANRGAVTLWLGAEGYTDGYRYSGVDSDVLFPGGGRDAAVRLRLGGSLEFVVTDHWNVWGILDGILAGNSRRLFGDFILNGEEDTEFYFRLGATYKF
jgi:hypothetical protein